VALLNLRKCSQEARFAAGRHSYRGEATMLMFVCGFVVAIMLNVGIRWLILLAPSKEARPALDLPERLAPFG
jgi:hypothetical protein